MNANPFITDKMHILLVHFASINISDFNCSKTNVSKWIVWRMSSNLITNSPYIFWSLAVCSVGCGTCDILGVITVTWTKSVEKYEPCTICIRLQWHIFLSKAGKLTEAHLLKSNQISPLSEYQTRTNWPTSALKMQSQRTQSHFRGQTLTRFMVLKLSGWL